MPNANYYTQRPVAIYKYAEALTWGILLLVLFCIDTSNNTFSFCLFKLAGFRSCWGCGIGHSIHDVLHGDFRQSWQHHMMGVPATLGIIYHIIKPFISLKKHYHDFRTNADDVTRSAAG